MLTVLLAAGWCVRAVWVPATSPSMTKDAERAKRMERWRRRRSGSGGLRALERRGRETSGSLEQRKRPAQWVGRRPLGPEPGRLTL